MIQRLVTEAFEADIIWLISLSTVRFTLNILEMGSCNLTDIKGMNRNGTDVVTK